MTRRETLLFTEAELRWFWDFLLARGFSVTEGTSAMFGRTWHFRCALREEWFLRTWLWERQTELVVRLGHQDHRGPVGPEHRFLSTRATEAHLDEALSDLSNWASRENEHRCPICDGWLYATEGEDGPNLACGNGHSASVALASAILYYE